MLPNEIVDATLEAELPGTLEWARRHKVFVECLLPAERILRVVLIQPSSAKRFFLQGRFDRYKELPPVWDWRDESWTESGHPALGPKPESTVCGSSMFLSHNNDGVVQAIICAPFNRLAFKTEGGPHNDWGNPSQWMTPHPPCVYATTIGDMVQAIYRDFQYTRASMA